jgi:hypothetical protein
MKNFSEWLKEQTDDRPTRHRVFSPLSIGTAQKNDFLATDPNLAYRVTGQPQIDDIKASGLVRAKLGQIKGGRIGETQWSQGGPNFKYSPLTNTERYILVTYVRDLNDKMGGLPKDDLLKVLKSDGQRWIDVTSEIKT